MTGAEETLGEEHVFQAGTCEIVTERYFDRDGYSHRCACGWTGFTSSQHIIETEGDPLDVLMNDLYRQHLRQPAQPKRRFWNRWFV